MFELVRIYHGCQIESRHETVSETVEVIREVGGKRIGRVDVEKQQHVVTDKDGLPLGAFDTLAAAIAAAKQKNPPPPPEELFEDEDT